jgi:Mg-chelatase subunit ChlD
VTLRFDEPVWLGASLVGVAMGVLALRWLRGMSSARRWSAAGSRLALMLLLGALLAGATRVRETRDLSVVLVVDLSASVTRLAEAQGNDGASDEGASAAGVEQRVREIVRRMDRARGPDDLLGLVVFDGSTRVVVTPTRGPLTGRSLEPSGERGSDLAGAIRTARAIIPAQSAGRIIVISDGNATTIGAADAARRARGAALAGGVPVDVVPVRYRAEREVVVERVDVPAHVESGGVATVRVVLRATSPARGTLQLLNEGRAIDLDPGSAALGRRVELEAGVNVVALDADIGPGRVHRFEAVFEPDLVRDAGGEVVPDGDTFPDNNRASAFALGEGAGSVLLVSEASSSMLADALRGAGVDVAQIAPDAMPLDMLALQAFDAIILEDVPRDALPSEAPARLAEFTRDLGGGLVLVGGPSALTAGNWRGSELDPILPVDLRLPERVLTPELALMLVIDRSGSMGFGVMGSSRSKMFIAAEAAAQAVASLDERDLIGVIAFDRAHDTIVPLSPNRDSRATAEKLRSIAPNGGTTIGPALAAAGEALGKADARVRHVIVISDGRSTDADELPGIATELAARGISVSAIAVGDEADTEGMRSMSLSGGGAFYSVINPSVLPRVLLRAVRVARSPAVAMGRFTPRAWDASSPLLAPGMLPEEVGGYVVTQRRESPGVTTALVVGAESEPLLAHWNVGLGQVVVYTSDAGAWARAWPRTPAFAEFWSQLIARVRRGPGDGRTTLDARWQGGTLRLVAQLRGTHNEAIDGARVPVSVYAPDGTTREVELVQTGVGRYEASVSATEGGAYVAIGRPVVAGRALSPAVAGATGADDAEMRAVESNADALRAIASAGEGRVREWNELDDLFSREGVPRREARSPIAETLLVWCLAVALLDVATRRVAWDRLLADAARSERAAGAKRERAGVGLARPVREREDVGAVDFDAAGESERIAREARERRLADRLKKLREQGAPEEPAASAGKAPSVPGAVRGAGHSSSPREAPIDVEPERPAETGESGLLAAKRRARERMERDE